MLFFITRDLFVKRVDQWSVINFFFFSMPIPRSSSASINNTIGQDNKTLILFHERKVDYESYVRNIVKLFSAGNDSLFIQGH